MTYRYLTNLADVVRSAGLKVVETPGWKTRGRPSYTGGFDPVGVLCHHTATGKSTSNDAVLRLLIEGRSDLPGPLCQLSLGRDGIVYVVAAGRANHAGTAKASGTVAAGDGNSLYIGIEAMNDGVGEPWPAVQYDAYVRLCAVLCEKVTGNSVQTVRGHKETSVTGKIDPTFDMDAFRAKVAAAMKGKPKDPKPRADFTTAHASGLWSNPPAAWTRLINAVKDDGARLVTLTETTRDGWLRDVIPNGWAFDRNDDKPGQSECSLLWSKRTWEDLGPAYSSQLATTRFQTGKGFMRPPVTAITKPLGHKKTGLELLVTVLHAPSSVQGPNGFKGTAPRLAAYREAIDAVHESWARGKDKHPDAARLLCGDWNLDYRLEWVRKTWATEFPLLTPCWEGRIPERGTHGRRVIDWAAASPQLECVGAKVLPTVDGFDHRPLVVKYAVKP